MNEIAISACNLGKQYRITATRQKPDTLREAFTSAITRPYKRLIGRRHERSSKQYIWALKDVSFKVQKGKVLGIIGKNGAGKTTLLKLLSRITEPTEGHAEVLGRVGSLLEVGTGFHLELSGRENIYLSGAILGMKKKELDRKFDEIMSFAELEKFIDTPVKRYSSGMFVRLAFAVAAHLEPEILLVDEVLAVGDVSFQQKCFKHIRKLRQNGCTVLVVSHNLITLEAMCEDALILSQGKVAGYTDIARAIEIYRDILQEEEKPHHMMSN